MSESFLISVREGFEAALVVSIVLAYASRTGDRAATRSVWVGTGAAIAASVAVGVVLHITVDGLTGDPRLRTFAAICGAAGALLTWMIFWMRSHGRALKVQLEQRTASALAGGSAVALGLVAFSAVIREGLETALFLLSTAAASGSGSIVAGTLLGLVAATGLGVVLYKSSGRIDVRRFFQITGALLILFAAGLVAKGVFFLQAAGDLGSFDMAAFDLTRYRWLTVDTQTGRFLAGIFGWDPRPSIEQVAGYLACLIPIAWLYFRPTPAPAPTTAPTSPELVSADRS